MKLSTELDGAVSLAAYITSLASDLKGVDMARIEVSPAAAAMLFIVWLVQLELELERWKAYSLQFGKL